MSYKNIFKQWFTYSHVFYYFSGIVARTRAPTAWNVTKAAAEFLSNVGCLSYKQIEIGKKRLSKYLSNFLIRLLCSPKRDQHTITLWARPVHGYSKVLGTKRNSLYFVMFTIISRIFLLVSFRSQFSNPWRRLCEGGWGTSAAASQR